MTTASQVETRSPPIEASKAAVCHVRNTSISCRPVCAKSGHRRRCGERVNSTLRTGSCRWLGLGFLRPGRTIC